MLSRRAEVGLFMSKQAQFVVDARSLALLGATNPLASAPGTIRGDYAIVSGQVSQDKKTSSRVF